MQNRKEFTQETITAVTVVLILTAMLLLLSGGRVCFADSLTQVTLPSGQNCQVSVIAGQTYVNC